jgi:hypothetical protein
VKKRSLATALLVSLTTFTSNAFGINRQVGPIARYVTPIAAFDDAMPGAGTAPRVTMAPNPDTPLLVVPRAKRPNTARFFDTSTKIELAVSGAALAADAFTTARNDMWPEQNPLLGRWPSNGRIAGYFAAAYTAEIGGMYLMRRHRWIKRAIPLVVTAVELRYVFLNTRRAR